MDRLVGRMLTGKSEDRMEVSGLQMAGAMGAYEAGRGPQLGAGGEAGTSFMEMLNRRQPGEATGEDERQKTAEKAVGNLLSEALVLPVLKQVRRGTFGQEGIFKPGIGEKTFGPEFDRRIADRIAQSPKLHGIAVDMANRWLHKGKPAARGGSPAGFEQDNDARIAPGVEVYG